MFIFGFTIIDVQINLILLYLFSLAAHLYEVLGHAFDLSTFLSTRLFLGIRTILSLMLNSHDLIFFCIIVRTCMRVLIDSFTQLSCHIGPDLFLRLGSRLTLILLLELGRRLGELHFNNLVVNLVGFQL